MANIFNENSVKREPCGAGALRPPLLTAARVPGTAIVRDRLTIAANGDVRVTVPDGSAAWLQGLGGETVLRHSGGSVGVSDAHVAFLPPGMIAHIQSAGGVAFSRRLSSRPSG